MLKSELILRRVKIRGNTIVPILLPADDFYLSMSRDLIRLIREHLGRTRGELDDAIREYEGDSLDYPIIRGLASVLESRCTFSSNTPSVDPVELRESLFHYGPVTYKSSAAVQTSRTMVVSETAAKYGLTEKEVEIHFFTDLPEEKVLLDPGELPAPQALIARYNTEVARGILYWAREVRIAVRDNYKDLFKYIKLFKLMHTISEAAPRGYNITLHGPISPFVKSTIRYGLQFAKFLPALFLCQSWRMDADVQPPNSSSVLTYTLDDTAALQGHFKGSGNFDSQLEADFAEEFEAKYGGSKRFWELAREDELIVVGDTVMIPDFSLTHRKDGRRVLIEIVGFWHPQYLRRKLKKVRDAGRKDLILLIYESANISEAAFKEVSAGEVLSFARKPVLKKVLEAAERCAVPGGVQK
jgi:predicted nuclease of restriction endonuclease-like RecB superfamily